MPARPDSDDYRALFLADAPMMDMRAPAEFSHGAFPSAHNLPLMTDDERAQVGICYKEQGQAAAIKLGHELVSDDVREQRLSQWQTFAQQHPQGYLYCFRGGLRSQTVQQWLRDSGVEYPVVRGGYKAMRRFLIEELARSVEAMELVLIGGRTGVGKTRVIDRLARVVDLEGLACHRGSAFGQLLEPQPSQIDFENALSIALMKLLDGGNSQVYLEDEGRLIGRVSLPDVLRERMGEAPLVIVDEPIDRRVDVVVEDYIVDLGARYSAAFGDQGAERHQEKLQNDLLRIRKRLGGALQQSVSDMMTEAFVLQQREGDLDGHRAWIRVLLADYYDPMYDYQLSRREGERLFSGNRDEVVAWVGARSL